MGNTRVIKTTVDQIVSYWAIKVDESTLSIDFSEAHERCWRCAYKTKLERCHIIPHSLGGQDAPENLVLLCRLCHAEGPNISDPDFFWDWLKAHNAIFYDTYWIEKGMKEYQFIYKKPVVQELLNLKFPEEQILCLMKQKMKNASWHWGQPRMNPATIAGVFRMMVKELQTQIENQ
jgi:hypothetical protein